MAAFVSATLLPGGSEALLIYRLQDQTNIVLLIATASLGNILGSLLTYAIGLSGHDWLQKRLLHISDASFQKAEKYFQRFGRWFLLFAWLPIIGDPLCLVAGVLRTPLWSFCILVSIGKIARYSIVAYITLEATQH